jgi:hypothetical protein
VWWHHLKFFVCMFFNTVLVMIHLKLCFHFVCFLNH